MIELRNFNVFGMARLERTEVWITMTAVGEVPIHRVYKKSLEKPILQIPPGEFVFVSFGAFLEEGKKTHVTIHEVTGPNQIVASKIPGFSKILSEALDMIRMSAHMQLA